MLDGEIKRKRRGKSQSEADCGQPDGALGEDLPEPVFRRQVAQPGIPSAGADRAQAAQDPLRCEKGQQGAGTTEKGGRRHHAQHEPAGNTGIDCDPLARTSTLDQQDRGQLEQLRQEGRTREDGYRVEALEAIRMEVGDRLLQAYHQQGPDAYEPFRDWCEQPNASDAVTAVLASSTEH